MMAVPNAALLSVLAFLPVVWSADHASSDPVICGGFVQSKFPIDYSKIEVRLLDKAGNLKYQAQCSPNNGNYEVPVFGKKGDFVLAVHGPEGLTFEPSTIPVNIDGVTDPCSKQQNLDFHFVGYSLLGKVNSKMSQDGPAGVAVTVLDGSKTPVYTTVTGPNGRFSVPNMLPGVYTIQASHPQFVIEKATVSATLTDGTLHLPDGSLLVSGYPVTGSVKSSGEPIADVQFVLYSKSVRDEDLGACNGSLSNDLPKEHSVYGKQVCQVKSDHTGAFTFPSLVPGVYVIIPAYRGGGTKYNIEPTKAEILVQHEPLLVPVSFEVNGFTATGTVMTSSTGSGVPSAEIYVNNTMVTKTDRNGIYRLERTVTGWYKIEVKKEYYDFPTAYLKITPTEPKIPVVYARSMMVCGEILTIRPVTRILSFEAIDLATQIPRDTAIRDNKFCILLEAGQHRVSIFDAPQDKTQRLVFSPSEKVINLKDFPITDLVFKQVLGTVSGSVKCLGVCPVDLKVSLLTGGGETFSVVDAEADFQFSDVDLGTHTLKIVEPSKRYCWDLVQKSVELTTNKPKATVGFRQTGFLFEVWSSHPTAISYRVKGQQENSDGKLKAGFGELCLPKAGEYEIEPKSCHKFENDVYLFNTESPARLNIHAIGHLANISVDTDDDKSPYKLRVKKGSDGSSSIFSPSGPPRNVSAGLFQYTFLEHFAADENIVVYPSSETLIFKPVQAELTVTDQCDKNIVVLEAFKGVIIVGNTVPAVPDVDITLTTETEVLQGKTDAAGVYSLGPLPRSSLKSITASKRGYEFEAVEGGHDFKSIKLSEIRVVAADADKKPISGVLVSISNSAGLRMNNFTDQSGIVSFINVGRGDYVIRPMIKEFRFDPSSKSASLAEGQTAVVEWSGTRIAYSASGTVASIGGEGEPGITMEAVSREPCPQMQEEAISDTDGQFRIHGLKADCEYEIRPKAGELEKMEIKWTAPANRTLRMQKEDAHGLMFRAFRGFNDAEFTGRVDATKEFLSQLKVCLYRGDRPDESVQCISFSVSPMFQFNPVPLDSRDYVIRIETSLSKKEFVYTNPELAVKANSTFRHFVLPFVAIRRQAEPEITAGTFWVVPLAIIGAAVYYNRSNVIPAVKNAVNSVRSSSLKSSSRERRKGGNAQTSLAQTTGEGSFDDYMSGGPTGVKKRAKQAKT